MTIKMNNDARRTLWRYNIRLYSESFLEQRLETEISNLLSDFAELHSQLSALRWRPSQLIETFDDAITHARSSLYAKGYKEAVSQIEKAQRALIDLREAKDADGVYEAANRAYKKALELVRFPPLAHLITLKALKQLLSEAGRLLRAAKYRQARLLARICCKELETLLSPASELRKTKSLAARINQLEELSAGTREFASNEHDDPLGIETIERLRSLLADRRLRLAEALIKDLGGEFASRRAFLSIYEQRIKPPAGSAVPDTILIPELREIISASSWDAASQRILNHKLDDALDETQSINSSLAKVYEALSGMLSAQPAES